MNKKSKSTLRGILKSLQPLSEHKKIKRYYDPKTGEEWSKEYSDNDIEIFKNRVLIKPKKIKRYYDPKTGEEWSKEYVDKIRDQWASFHPGSPGYQKRINGRIYQYRQNRVTGKDELLWVMTEGRKYISEIYVDISNFYEKYNKQPVGRGVWYFSLLDPKYHDIKKDPKNTFYLDGWYRDVIEQAKAKAKKAGSSHIYVIDWVQIP